MFVFVLAWQEAVPWPLLHWTGSRMHLLFPEAQRGPGRRASAHCCLVCGACRLVSQCRGRPTAKCRWWSTSSGWPQIGGGGALFCCPLCLKGSSVVPLCLLGSQQVLTHFEPTFFSSPVEESPSPMTHVDSVSLTPVA